MAAKNRTRQILGEPAQKAILAARDDHEIYCIVTKAAVYLASSGFLDLGNQLLARLWSCELKHSRNVWLADRAMSVLWHHVGQCPASIPFPVQEIDAIELAHRSYMTGNRWSDAFLDNEAANSPEALAIKRLAKAMIASCPATTSGPMPNAATEIQAITDFDAFVQSNSCMGFNSFSALTNLVELCAKNGRMNDAVRYLFLWHDFYVAYWSNFSFECLAACRHAAPLLLKGLLAPICKLDAKSSADYAAGLLDALERRMAKGTRLVYGTLSWQKLLKEISKTAIRRGEMQFSAQAKKEKWLGATPASEREIRDAEIRLNVTFPEDYKQFLHTANGFDPVRRTAVRIFPVQNVQPLVNAIPDLVKAWDSPVLQDVHQSLLAALLIGDLEGEQQLLLIPDAQGKIKGEWHCWFFASWVPGEERHPSFRAYMESVLLELESED